MSGCSWTDMDDCMSVLKDASILLVGAGGIGCEVIKNLILCGAQKLVIVDMDTIDISNLNRQFLYQKKHVKMYKAEVACQRAQEKAPERDITAKVCNVLEWKPQDVAHFDVVLNALDNIRARSHINYCCISAGVPLIESGSTGFNGQVYPIVKDITKCYECHEKPRNKSIPVCTIRQIPEKSEHCIAWAQKLYELLFGTQDNSNVLSDLDIPRLPIGGPISKDQAYKWISELFNFLFNSQILDLVAIKDSWPSGQPPMAIEYPFDKSLDDTVVTTIGTTMETTAIAASYTHIEDDVLYHDVSSPIYYDIPIENDNKNHDHQKDANIETDNYIDVANQIAIQGETGDPLENHNPTATDMVDVRHLRTDGQIWKQFDVNDEEEEGYPSKMRRITKCDGPEAVRGYMAIGEKMKKYSKVELAAQFRDSLINILLETPHLIGRAIFDKDDAWCVQFVAAAANLRMINFHIPQLNTWDVQSIAGSIIPANAATNAIVAAAQVMQLIHLLHAKREGGHVLTKEAFNESKCRFVWIKSSVTGSNPLVKGSLCSPETLEEPNPKCVICQQNIVKLEIRALEEWTLQQFVERICKSRLSMEMVNVDFGERNIYDSELFEEDEVYARRVIDHSMSHWGLEQGSILTVTCLNSGNQLDILLAIEPATAPGEFSLVGHC